MIDDGEGSYHELCEQFPGEVNKDRPVTDDWGTDGILRDVALTMAHEADCAVIARVLLDRFGYRILTTAIERAASDDVSGAAVTKVAEMMAPVLNPDS